MNNKKEFELKEMKEMLARYEQRDIIEEGTLLYNS